MDSGLKLTGHIHIEVRGKDGTLLETREITNTVTSAGRSHVADRLSQIPVQSPMSNMAIGTGTPGTTALGAELSRRVLRSVTDTSNVVTYVGEWNIDDSVSGTITEAGIFNADSGLGGTMLCSGVISPAIVKTTTSTLTLTWNLTIG